MENEELQFICGPSVANFGNIIVNFPDGDYEIIEKEEMKVLGVRIDKQGSSGTSIDFNLSRAEGAYGVISHLLKDKTVPVEERLKAWCRGPVGAAVYAAGGWALGKSNIHQLRRWEYNHIRAFLSMIKMSENEGVYEFSRRTNRNIMGMFVKYGIDPIYVMVDLQIG